MQNSAQNLKDAMDIRANESKACIRTLSAQIHTSNTSIANLTTIWDQILSFVKTFPQEIRGRLQAITQADWRTYQAVLRLQDSISATPTSLHESNIHFTNALGEYRPLPYDLFCHWEVCAITTSYSNLVHRLIGLYSLLKGSSVPNSKTNQAKRRSLMGASTLLIATEGLS